MSTEPSRGVPPHRASRHLSADQIRGATFERAPFGRRGFEEQEVQAYLGRVAEELAARDAEITRLTNENRQLKHALREWHRQLVGYDAAELIARAQQQIEAQISQAESYSREREIEATRRYDEMIAEARRRAQDEAQLVLEQIAGRELERMAGSGSEAGPGPGSRDPLDALEVVDGADPVDRFEVDGEWLGRQRTYAFALLQALDALAAQVDATRQAFTFEVSKLGDIADPVAELALPEAPDGHGNGVASPRLGHLGNGHREAEAASGGGPAGPERDDDADPVGQVRELDEPAAAAGPDTDQAGTSGGEPEADG